MKLNLILILILLAFNTCKSTKKKEFTLYGTIKGDAPKYIFLEYNNIRDSSLVKNKMFFFKGKVNFPISAELIISPISTINKTFYLENNKIEINISVNKKLYNNLSVNFIKIDSIKGSETAIIQSNFELFRKKHKSDLDWNEKIFKKLSEIIEQNPRHHYSGDLLSVISNESILNKSQLLMLYKKLDTLKQSTLSLSKLRKKIYTKNSLTIGKEIFDFELLDKNGNKISTKNYRGTTLLIDFWASWCTPCRKQNTQLLKIYNNFKSEGFEVLGVSIDKNKFKWLRAIKKDKLTWENVIDSNGIKSKILTKYNTATSVPHNFLIDQYGKIIAIDISMNDLEKQIKLITNK